MTTTRIILSEENRRNWIDYAMASDGWPDEDWFDKIKQEKPNKITTGSFAEYMAVVWLDRQKVLSVSGVSTGQTSAHWVFIVSYPQPQQQSLL